MQPNLIELTNILDLDKNKIEYYLENTIKREIDIEHGKLRSENTINESGIAIRTIKNNSLGFSYSTNLNKNSIDFLIEQSIKSGTKVPNTYDFAPNIKNVIVPKDIFDQNIGKINITPELNEIIQEIKHKKISLDKLMLTTKSNSRYLLNSNNLNYNYQDSLVEIEFLISSSNKFVNRMFVYRKLDLEKIKKDFRKTIDMLMLIKKLPRKRLGQYKKENVIFSPYTFSNIVSCIFPSIINAATVYNNDSFLKVNEKIYNKDEKDITLITDGTLDGGIFSSPIDGEGFPSKKTTIIDKSIFVKPICNNYWSSISNFENTANSSRLDFRSFPNLDTKNLIFEIDCDKVSLDEIFHENRSIYITGLFPDPSRMNIKTGEYLFNVFESIYVEKGKMKSLLDPFLLFIDSKSLDIDLVSKEQQDQLGISSPYVSAKNMNIVPMPGISKKDIIIMFLKKIYDSILI